MGTKRAAPRRSRGLFALRLLAAVAYLALSSCAYLRFWPEMREWGRFLLTHGQISARAVGAGFFGVLAVAAFLPGFLFGRVYCSVFCPMGTLQEIVWRLSGRLRTKGRRFVRPWRARYLVVLLAAVGILFGIPPFVILFDPASNFGRGLTGAAALAAGTATATTAGILALFAVVLLLSAFRGRRFCDWCPVGTTLGFAAEIAPFGVTMDANRCVSCGVCERTCPMNCIDGANRSVDRARCVLCLGCLPSCPGGHISYGRQRGIAAASGRRDFLKGTAALCLGAGYLGGRNMSEWLGTAGLFKPETAQILPPGAVSTAHYLARCIGCGACTAACPVGIVRAVRAPQPVLDYTNDYCQYRCVECGRACPTGAIRHLAPEEKMRTRVALSELDLERCVVVRQSQACGACAEVCPTRALHMAHYGAPGSGLTIPVFDEAYCIGCGACLFACPAAPSAFALHPVSPQTVTPGMRPTSDEGGSLPEIPNLPDGGFPF